MATLTDSKPPVPSVRLNLYDRLFIAFLVLVFGVVIWLGVYAHQEALKTEAAKGNGEAWVTWFKEASAKRFEANYTFAACAGGTPAESAKPSPEPGMVTASPDNPAGAAIKETNNSHATGSWGACLAELMQNSSFKDMRNPFNGGATKYVEACVPTDLSNIGGIDIEKSVATPPGSAIPFIKSNLASTDSIKEKLLLTVIVCDKGGYPIKIAELEF